MILIQIIFDLIIIFFIVNLFSKLKRQEISLISFILWLIFWLEGILIINWPESSSFLARILGISRGADAIIYFSIIFIFYFIFYFIIKLRKIEKEITSLVRKITFLEKNQ